MLTTAYEKQARRPVVYVSGSIWFSDMMSLYSTKEIKPMIFVDPDANPWFDRMDFEQKGALVVAENEKDYASYNKKLKRKLPPSNRMEIAYKNLFGKKKVQTIYWGIYE